MVFGPFWSENGYRIHFAYFGLELGIVFEGTTGMYERICLFETFETCEFEIFVLMSMY